MNNLKLSEPIKIGRMNTLELAEGAVTISYNCLPVNSFEVLEKGFKRYQLMKERKLLISGSDNYLLPCMVDVCRFNGDLESVLVRVDVSRFMHRIEKPYYFPMFDVISYLMEHETAIL